MFSEIPLKEIEPDLSVDVMDKVKDILLYPSPNSLNDLL